MKKKITNTHLLLGFFIIVVIYLGFTQKYYKMCYDVAYFPVQAKYCSTLREVQLSLIPQETPLFCPDGIPPVPQNIFAVNRDGIFSEPLQNLAKVNTAFTFYGLSDRGARDFIEKNCGLEYAQAYDCFNPPAYRADLFRFCALWSFGGIYFDSDMIPTLGIEQLYDACSDVTAGADLFDGIQTKIIASRKKNPHIKCALDKILSHVKNRFYGSGDLEISGPKMFSQCMGHPRVTSASLLYIDTRDALFPYNGLRNNRIILAYEHPSGKHFERKKTDYAFAWKQKKVYSGNCVL